MADQAVLPDEEPDTTTSELHVRVLVRLFAAVRYALKGQALVLMDIFLRVEGREQAATDLLVAPPAPEGARTVYSYPDEPLPLTTVEILSASNYEGEGKRKLEHKRELFGRIGVPLHLEIDPAYGVITSWTNDGCHLQRSEVSSTYHGPGLGGVRIDTPAPGEVHIYLPDGREVLDPEAEIATAEALVARVEAEETRAKAEAARANRLAERLRQLGFDPDEVD